MTKVKYEWGKYKMDVLDWRRTGETGWRNRQGMNEKRKRRRWRMLIVKHHQMKRKTWNTDKNLRRSPLPMQFFIGSMALDGAWCKIVGCSIICSEGHRDSGDHTLCDALTIHDRKRLWHDRPWGTMQCQFVFVSLGLWMNSSTRITTAVGPGLVSRKYPLIIRWNGKRWSTDRNKKN